MKVNNFKKSLFENFSNDASNIDMQFPVDITSAEQDHPQLDPADLHSLFRRLQALNRCARIHQQRITHTDDSEDEQCALSNNWTYQSDLRRWSRNCQNMQIRK